MQKSGVSPGMCPSSGFSGQGNLTCSSCDLEIKTDKFLFCEKQRDKLLFVYLSSFGVFRISDRNND